MFSLTKEETDFYLTDLWVFDNQTLPSLQACQVTFIMCTDTAHF